MSRLPVVISPFALVPLNKSQPEESAQIINTISRLGKTAVTREPKRTEGRNNDQC
jgi:hypothetical protein